jgi:hypothetical protein
VSQATTVSLVKNAELRLAKMRRQLEGMFHHLNVIHDEISVTADAARSEGMPATANVLSLSACNRLFGGQLRQLTNIIERLGGTTELPEDDETWQETAQQNARHETKPDNEALRSGTL